MFPGMSKLLATDVKLVRREPATMFFTLLFGPALITLFGLLPAFHGADASLGGLTALDVYVPTVIVLALALASLNALPQMLASYREKGYLRRMSTTPVRPASMLASQLVVISTVSVASLLMVLSITRLAFGVPLPHNLPGYLLTLALAGVSLFSIGLAIAALVPNSKVAGPVGSALTFPMMYFAGLWTPRAQMPPLFRHISDYTPFGAAAHALQDSWSGHPPQLLDLEVMAAYAVVFGLVAAKTFRWE